MPQIAQQDYIIIKPAVALSIYADAAALGRAAAIMERKDTTIFDVIFDCYGDGTDFEKVIAAFIGSTLSERSILIFSADDAAPSSFRPIYTSTQYEGLAAVQLAGQDIDGGLYRDALPVLVAFDEDGISVLTDNSGYYITDTEGHKIIVTASSGNLATVEISSEIFPSESVKVSFEDIQKLIGLPIA